MATDYISKATQEVDPQIAAQKTALANALAMKLAGYDSQKNLLGTQYNKNVGLANQTYDTQVNNQNLSTQKQQNTYSNAALGRGLGRSTIAQTGTQEIGNIGSRLVGNINTNRHNALQNMLDTYNTNIGNIEGLKTAENTNYNNTLASLDTQRQNQIAALARQLEDTDWERNYKMQQLAIQRANSYGGGNGGSKSSKSSSSGVTPTTSEQVQALVNVASRLQAEGDTAGAAQARAQAQAMETRLPRDYRFDQMSASSSPSSSSSSSSGGTSILGKMWNGLKNSALGLTFNDMWNKAQ